MHINENILLSSTRFKKQGDFWIDKLSGISDKEETNLLFTGRRHTGAQKDRRQIDFSLPCGLVQQMVKLSKKSDFSIYILLLVGLKSLIYRYTGNKDIFVVSPLYQPDVSDETINDVLLIRDALYEEMSFKELVLTVRQSLLDAYENQDYPFDRLAEACLSPRQLENNPFMTTVACVFENIHDYDERLAARLKDQVIFLFRLDRFRMSCSIIFDPGHYEPYYIEKIPGHFTSILEQSVNDINIKISEIFYLSEQEKKCLLYDYSNREYRYPVEPACYKLFEGQVEKTPDKVALVYEDSYLTYRELNECSLRLAYVLRERGVTAGTIAALMVEPSFFMIIGIMGILRAGGAFLPIGADYPEERIDYMLKDSNARVLLKKSEIRISKSETNPNDRNSNDQNEIGTPIVLNFEHLNFEFVSNFEFRASNLSSSNLAYIIYTSGSTGRPKGVLITQGNLTPMLLWSRDYFGLGEHTRVLQNLSYTFDFGVFELLTTLVFGGTLYFFNRAALTDALEYTAYIDRHQINTLHTTPSFLNSILSPGEQMSSLRILHLGGERLSGTLIDTAARQLSPGCCIYNGYGPTETTINSSIFKVVPGMDMSYRDSTKTADNTPIGKPSANNIVYILDSRRRLVPIGAAGELFIGGGGVAPGYLNRPELTAEKFVDYRSYRSYRTYSLYFSKKLYKTGDLGCWLPDGNIEFLGRIDHQVKIRGYRVELGEIESRLLEYPGIKEALVIARDHFLCAYIVRGDADSSFFARLKEYLSQKLPDYMVPSYLLELDKIPLTPSGKADRRALPEPETGISGEDYAAPLGRLEEELVSIWGELLGIEKDLISVNADFFQLGGHSLLAMGLISKLHQRLDVKIPLGQVLQTPTIRELAATIKGTAKDKHLSLEKSEEKEYYVLSSAQKRMYILQQMELESIGYNIPIARVFKGKIDKEKLEEAFNKLISRHESLRTSFHLPGEEPVQKIHKTVDFEIEYISTEDTILHFFRPFDLSKAPLLRVGLIKEDENRHILMLDMHHIISDGISMDLIVRDFGVLYDGKELPELRFRYRDYAEWQIKQVQQEAIKKQELFWLQTFAEEAPLLNLPTDYSRPVVQGFEGASITFEIGGEESESVHHLARSHGGTVFMVVLAVVYTWLAKLSNQEDIVVGTPTAGRRHVDLHDIVGMFVNTLALRNYPSGEKPFAEFLEELKDNVLAGFENQDYQFEDLVEKLSLTRDTDRNPIFYVMFAFQSTDQLSKRNIKTETDFFKHLEPYETDIKIAKFDLSLTGDEVEGRFLFTCEYSTTLFRKESIERFIHYFKNIINAVIRDSGQRLWEIEILPEVERERVLFSFNQTKAEYPAGNTIHELFEEQAARTPGHSAVISAERRAESVGRPGMAIQHLTYKELNKKSNQLARLLRKKGVQANSIVSLMVERSLEMIVGLYAILKAGAAYLPVETDYPAGRIRYMLEDSGSRFLLTREEYAANINFDDDMEIFNLEDESLYRGETGNLQGISTPGDLLYMIYTSGSTGKPKGVMVKIQGFVNLLHWYVTEFDMNACDCVLLIAPISFDLAQKNLYAPLITGGSLCLASPGLPDYHELSDTIAREQVTVINSAPSVFYPLIEFNSADNYSRLKSLRYLFLGGEPIQGDKLAPWLNGKTCQCELVNTYGPTECTDIASSFRVNKKDIGKQKNIPIGGPIYNVSLFVLDNYRQVVPIGVTGELCIGGIGLSKGYHKNPELTAAKFIQTPQLPLKEVYRTGDLAQWLADGNILFFGRIDHQVKVRGFRIELGEIEAKLQAHEKIKEAVVVARKNDVNSTYLCAYVVSHPFEIEGGMERETLNIPELREYLAGELPDSMVPSYYVQMEKLPLTPSGKTNRNALPEPETGVVGMEYAAPGNFEEEKLVGIWSEILRIKEKFISVNANFFELGGHSLLAVSMIAVIHKKLDVKVPLRQVLKNPTIRELARYVKRAEKESCAPIEPVEEKEYYVISSAQKRMYILQQMEVESIGYNIPMFQVIKGELAKGRFEEAVRELVARHESLRTSFHMMGEEPVQRIYDEVGISVERRAESVGQKEQDKELYALGSRLFADIIQNFVRPFDLSTAPLFRVGLREEEKNRHILMVDMHHIISDGISTDLILRDFMALLDEQELSELRIQYKDYAEWQQGQSQEEDMKKQETFWLKRFEDEIPVLNLPTDYVRPLVRSFAGAAVTFDVDEEETRGLCQLVQSKGGTVYMVLLAVVYTWLAKLGNQEDIVVGTPTAGRRHADLHDIVGMFVNTLALRNYPSGKKPFAEFFEELKENVLAGFENQDYQFEDLVEKLSLTRDTGRNPIFDVMFAFQSTDQLSKRNIKTETDFFKHLEPYETDIKIAKFDLLLTGNEVGNRIRFVCEYSTALFKRDTIQRFIDYFKRILLSVVNNCRQKISEVDVLSKEERNQLLEHFNCTREEYPVDKTVHRLFEAQTERTPHHIAVLGADNAALTYKKLNDKSNQLAHLLAQKGVKPGTIAAIMVERTLEMIVGILGILKAGGAYLPIDMDYPDERIRYMLDDSNARILLAAPATQVKVKVEVREDSIEPIEMIDISSELSSSTLTSTSIYQISSANLAYVIYTSGSTGRPKGVMIEHHSAVNLVFSQKQLFKINKKDRILQFSSICFDASVEQILISLFSGAVLVLIDKQTLLDIEQFERYILERSITHIHAVPSFLNNITPGSSYPFKRVISGGDVCPVWLAEKWCKDYEFYNEYGPTETTVTSIESLIEQVEDCPERLPIGRPLSNTTIYLLDRWMRPVPVRVMGELYIGGEGVARGYLNNLELTSERFISGPFKAGERLYRTGDLARWFEDGNIEFLGRMDQQVKIRGYRIEPEEIAHRLLDIHGVKEAVVIDRKSESTGEKYLCAYLVLETAGSPERLNKTELRDALSRELPGYMVPSYFVEIERIPMTPSGKPDRRSLPEPEISEAGGEYTAPGNEMEEQLVRVWTEVLGKRVGIHDNFFELGGHSLNAAVVVSRIHRAFDVRVPLLEFFKTPTIKGLSGYIKAASIHKYASIEAAEEKEYYVLSSAQKRMYVLQQMELESIGYNMPMFQVIKGELAKGRFEEAVRKLIARHESLRTSFHMMSEEPVQRIYDEVEFAIEYGNLNTEAASHFVRPFDLTTAPLFRVGLREEEKNRHILMVDIHHIISDGISTDLILRDFMALLDERELPELPIQYKDYAAWQQGQAQKQDIKKQETFWLKMFEDEIPVLNLPTDLVRPPVRSFEGAAVTFEADEEETRDLYQLVQSQGGTVYMVLLAVVYTWLAKLSNQEDIVVGTPTAGRRHADLHDIVGMFVNTLALRNYPSGKKPFAEFFEELKENVLAGFENQDYQFEDLVEKLSLTRDTGRNPIFDVMFAFQSTDQLSKRNIKTETDFFKHLEPYETDIKIAKFDLSLTGNEIENRLLFTCEYSTRLFKAGTIERFIHFFKTILSSIINDSCQALWEIEILGAEERHRLLYDLNATQWDCPQNKTLRDLFEDQVNKTPGNIAVVYEDRALTYRDLNTRARHLAGILISRGACVKPGMIVGIMTERSLELYVGILAILKSGSAYLPVDPEYPEDRINYMLKDSNVRLLLTREPYINRFEESYEYEIIDLESFHFRGMPVENWNWQETSLASGDLAYVIYTSGSTGVPRGVMVEHSSVVNLVVSKKKRFDMNSGEVDRVLQFSSICFDASVEQIFVAFCSGSVLVIIDRNTLLDKEAFAAYILRHGVTHLDVVPSFLREFDRQRRRLSCLQRVVCGGEVCPVELAEKWCGDYRFYNAYGPTETTVTSTEMLVEEVAEWWDHLPIGRPLDNTTVYILDRWENPVPFGVVGEMVIGGAGVARGYLNRPELTAEKFIDIHHSSLIIHHSYRTGDLVRWLTDGNLEYRGRIDHQVKIRGYRIEPLEIERRLLEIESIKEAVVTAKDTNGERYLCAYVVSAANETIRGPELRETLLKKLPAYMVPLYFVQLEEIPLTPGGKTDHKAFPEPEVSTTAGGYAAPGNMVEEKLMEIWSDVLIGPYRVIGIHDNFFELGGHSLNAAVVVSRIHRAFDVRVPLLEFFKIPTIKGLSGYIKAASKEKYVSITVVEEKEYYILSSAQKRLYYLQQLVPESTAYNMPHIEVLDKETGSSREKLEQTFRRLIRRHESLRTSFHIVGNEPVQRVQETVDFEIEYYTEDISRDLVRPFDLAKAPLMRVGLIKAGDYESKIIIDMHHIAADGISTAVLLRDFTALYKGEELAELRFQYKDYAVWQQLKKEKGALKAQQDYWERQFNNDIPVLNLPTDYARPELQRFEGNIVRLEKSNEETRLLKQLASEQGTTLFMILLTLYNILLFKITGQGDIVVGVPIAGRGHADLEKIIGMFINTLPIRNRLLPEQTFEELLKDVKEKTLSAFENQDCQLEDIVEMIGGKRDPGRNPLFDVMFAFQGTDMQPEENSWQIETDSHTYEYENRISKFDMTLTAVEGRENLILIFDYSIRLFKKETVERFVEYFKEIINTVLDNPEIQLENIRVLHDLYNERISLPQLDIEF